MPSIVEETQITFQNGHLTFYHSLMLDQRQMIEVFASPAPWSLYWSRKGARQIGFSDLWQMAVLTLETSRGHVLLLEIKGINRREIPAHCASK